MKCALYGWTDCPMPLLGDSPGLRAPVRPAKILSYDGDKYCLAVVSGAAAWIKRGYLYRRKGRFGEVPAFRMRDLRRIEGA